MIFVVRCSGPTSTFVAGVEDEICDTIYIPCSPLTLCISANGSAHKSLKHNNLK